MEEKMIVRHVVVDRSRTPQQALESSVREKYISHDHLVKEMPRADEKTVEIVFFVPRSENVFLVLRECKERGLVPADPLALLQINEEDPEFARDFPNGTVWGDSRISFFNNADGDVVAVGYIYGWPKPFWFAGIRK